MSRRTVAWLAWSMWALSLALTVLSLWLLVLPLSYPDGSAYTFWAEGVLVAAGFSTVGAVIVSRMPPENPIGWLLCATGFLWAAHHFAAEYANYASLAAPGLLPAGQAAAWTYTWLSYLSLGLIVYIFLLFPDGRVPSRRWRWFARLSALLTAVAMVLAAFSSGPIVVGLPHIHNPLGIGGLPNVYKPLLLVFMIVLGAVAATSLLMRWLHARGIERQQIKWFAYATSVGISGAILRYIISEPLEIAWLGGIGRVLVLAGLAGIPISLGIAILRYRLYDIDVLINRTLVYGALTALLAAGYFGAIMALQGIGSLVFQGPFRAVTGQETQLATVAATLAMAALFNPLRRRIQGFIDRSFYRRKYDAARTLEAFSAKLREETNLDALSGDLVGAVRETMQPAHVTLWLRPAHGPRRRGGIREPRG